MLDRTEEIYVQYPLMEEMRSGKGCVVMKNASPWLGDRSTSTPSPPALAAFAHATLPLQVWQRFGTEISAARRRRPRWPP